MRSGRLRLLTFVSAVLSAGFAEMLCPPGVLHADSQSPRPGLCINEVLAVNVAALQDPQGEYDDWIELYNAGEQPIDCGGMYLTDDLANPTKWQIPSRQPAGYHDPGPRLSLDLGRWCHKRLWPARRLQPAQWRGAGGPV